MRLSLDALETLDAIAEAGSFARAAERLHRVPSALTYTINKLESDLGVAIFDRSGKRAELTVAGRELLEKGRDLLRQAETLERRVKRVALGWETQLTIAVDEVLPLERVLALVPRFDALGSGTRLRFTQEVFGGTWDALIDKRADLAIAAPGDTPEGFGLSTLEIGRPVTFVYAVAPDHPLATEPEPLEPNVIARHRAIVAADSSRRLRGRSQGVQPNQETLVVPTIATKLQAQLTGLGVGFLPDYLVAEHVAAGRLIVKSVKTPRAIPMLRIAWREGDEGNALLWFRDHAAAAAAAGHLFPRAGAAAEHAQAPGAVS